MTEFQTGAEERTKTADNLVVAIKNQLNAAQESSQACAQSANAIKAINEEANGALSAISATAAQASEQLTLATSHTKGAAAQLQNATQHAADAKAKSDTVAGHLANAKQYEEEIDAFYAEIETHKTTMLEVKKKADSDLAKLKSGHHLLCTIGRDDTPGVSDVFCGGPVQEGTPGRRGVCI